MLQRSDISASHLMLRNTAGEMAVYCGQHERKPKRTLFVRKKSPNMFTLCGSKTTDVVFLFKENCFATSI